MPARILFTKRNENRAWSQVTYRLLLAINPLSCPSNVIILFLYIVIVLTAGPAKCVPLKAKVCEGAGYDYTANFLPIDGKSYQEVKSRSLQFFLDFLKICSPYSKAVMCSFSMPKCVEGVERPIPPCRSVCLEFVGSCQMLLSLASHAGLFRALCDLLPEQDSWPNTCFVPDGFKRTLPAGGSIFKVITDY